MPLYNSYLRLLFCLLFCVWTLDIFAQCNDVTPQFTVNQTTFCGNGPHNIGITNTSNGPNAASADYEWLLDGVTFDNTTGLVNPINAVVTTPGTYNLEVIVTDGPPPCSESFSLEITVVDSPIADFSFNPNNDCAALDINFTNQSTNLVSGSTYSWDFGDGNTSTDENPVHAFNAGGSYTVTLTVENAPDCIDTYSETVTNLDIPNISISGDDGDGNTTNCLLPGDPTTSEVVNFTNGTTGGTSYFWDFGDGNTSTDFEPSHTYNTYGTFVVTMTATGPNGCTASATIEVVFERFVSASLNLDATEYSGCSPHDLTSLVNNSSNANDYVWDFGDGSAPYNTTDVTPPNHVYTDAGNYTISLTASNNCNTANATISPIIIVDKPEVVFTPSLTNGCAPENISFTNNSVGVSPANAYEWDMGNGNSYSTTVTPPNQNYDTSGVYTVSLTGSNACGDSTYTQTITLDTIPTAIIDVDPIEECSPVTFTFENYSIGNITQYTWYLDGVVYSNDSIIAPITFTYPAGNTPVEHEIVLAVSNACGTTSDTVNVIIHRPTEALFTQSETEVCLGDPVTFTDQSLGENLTFEWDFGDGTTASTIGPHTLTYAAPGTYTIELIADGYCGPDTLESTVIVHPYPVADFSPDLPDGCATLEMTFTNNSTPTANQNWDFGANATPTNSNLFNPGTVSFPTTGTEMIVLEVEENGCFTSDTNYIEIFPIPNVDFNLLPNEGCSELDVEINNSSVDNGTETFEWDFGNGSTFTGYTPPDQTYIANLNDSIYDIQLNVVSGDGCEDSLIQQVTVHPVPVADFEFIEDTICLNQTFATNNLSTPGTSALWGFGDGNTSNLQNPSHQYASEGTYTVQLIVSTPFSCEDTVEYEITVLPIPEAQFTNTTECLGYETEFTDNSTGNIVNWSWDFGDGNVNNTQNPFHQYGASGSFNVTLTVENDIGCSDDITQNVNVNDVPIADFSASEFCLGNNTSFTDLTIGATTQLEWDFGDGSPISNANNPSHVFPAIGNYDVQLVAFGGSGCSDTIIQTITITDIPIADFSFQTACTNDTTFFTDLSTGNPDTFAWDFGEGNTSTDQNPSHVYTTSGSYNVSLTVAYTASGCSNTITFAVDAHPRTEPQFIANVPCLGSETDFVDQTTNTPIFWEWDFDDGSPINTTQNPNHEYTSPGLYDVTLITENIYGCSDTATQTVEVFGLPSSGFEFDTVCLNAATSFTDASQNAVAWEYEFGDGNSSLNANPTHIYLSDGTFIVTQVVTNAEGCTDTLEREIIVRPNPTALWEADTACFSYITSFTDNSIDAVSWQWDLGELGTTSNQQNPQHVYSTDGVFNVELVVENIFGCSDTINNDVLVLPQPEAAFTNATVCAGSSVNFNNNSVGTPILFEWNFGDGSVTSNDENPTHTYATGGMYDITFIIENAAGCIDTLEQNIEVFTVPNVDFEADTVCLFSVTSFTDLTQDPTPLLSWDWDFGDGNTSFQQNPTYIYQNPGTYDVELTVTNVNGCDSTINHDVIVSEVPDADFTVVTDCFGAPTVFTDQSTNNPGIWLWDFGDGTTLNGGPNETHNYSSPGNYVVSLNVLSSDSICSDEMIQVITISQEAQADFFIPNQICATETFDFTDNSSTNLGTIDSYEWDMGDGTIYNTINGTHTYLTDGVYEVTLTITTSNGCQSQHSEFIEVFPITEANFDWSLACQDESIIFSNTSTGNTTDWFWDFDDGNVSTDQYSSHIYTSEGDYDVMLIVQNLAGCSDTLIQTVTVHPSPQVAFVFDEVCFGTATSFTDQSFLPTGSINDWSWDFGVSEGSSNLQNPDYTFTNYSDTHEVSLAVTSDQGCSDTLVQTVTLLPIVEFDINIDAMNGCAPFEVFFENSSNVPGADILNYTWDFGDSTFSFSESPTHLFNEPGEYEVVLTISTSTDCQIVNQDEILITVHPNPIAGFDVSPPITTIVDPTIEITDESNGASAWEYELGDGEYNNTPSFNHTYNEVGDYVITQFVYNEFGCTDTAVRAIRIQEDLIFYVPNTFTPDNDGRNDIFSWVIEGHETFEFRIFNRWGEEVFTTTDPYATWDGTHLGQKVKDGVYVWQAKILDLKDEEHLITGHVSVLR